MEGSGSFFFFMLSIGIFLGLTIGGFLLVNKSAKNRANIYLGLLVLFFSIQLWRQFIFYLGWVEYFPHILKIDNLFIFALGPITYFYVRACTQKNFVMRPILLLHFIPIIIEFFYQLPILTLSSAEKIEVIRHNGETGILINHVLLPITKTISGVIYFIISTRLVLKYRKHLSNTASTIDEAFHKWLLVFCSFLIYPLFGIGVYLTTGLNIMLFFGWTIFIIAVFASTLLKPELFHVFPHQMPIPESTEDKIQKYEKSKLQESLKEVYLKKLLKHIKTEKPYLEAELTLAEVAEQIDIPSHYLSQVINEKMNCSFLDFINNYRVEEAKNKLADSSFDHYTIIAIAFEVGFNSKTTFYSAFKKHAKTTPTSFRKSLIAS